MKDQKEYASVTVKAKVRIEDPVKVSPTLRRQNVTIADSSAAAKLTLWENSIGMLSLSKSYQFSNFSVRTYKSEKYISLPREGGTFKEIPDLADVVEDDLPNDTVVLTNAKVAAANLSVYRACLACNSKLEPVDDIICRCTRCDIDQLTENTKQEKSANLLVCSGAEYIQLSAFTNILHDIVCGDDITVPGLLTAPPFTCTSYTSYTLVYHRTCYTKTPP